MFNNVLSDYECPICLTIKGIENENTWIKQEDIFYLDDLVMGFISSKSIKGNEGHPLIVPIEHYENIYDLPEGVGCRIFNIGKKVAIALKELRSCDGVTLVQNNEPAGDQHAFHYHLHIIHRFKNDDFHKELWNAKKSDPKDRVQYAQDLRNYFK